MNSTLSHLIIYIVFMYGNLFSQTVYHHGDNWQAFDDNKLNAIGSELFDVLSYKLEVQIFPSFARIEAKNLIVLHALDDLQDNIYLDFAGLITDSVFRKRKKGDIHSKFRSVKY